MTADARMNNMTPVQLCRAIDKALDRVSEQAREEIKRTYEKTWLIFSLWSQKLATPTPAAKERLQNFLWALQREAVHEGN